MTNARATLVDFGRGTWVARFALAAVLLLVPERGGAQVGGFEVPPECGNELDFLAELERLAGADAPRARPSLLRIERDPATGAYRLTLDVGGTRRELEHADCHVLFRSAAVISAAAVKTSPALPPAPVARAVPPASAPPPAPAPEPTGATAADSAESRATSSGRGAKVHGELALGAGAVLGVLPGTAGIAELRGAVFRNAWGLSFAGRYYFPEKGVTVEGRSADISGFGLRAAGVLSPLPWLACSLGVDVDRLSGRGSSGVSNPTTDSAWTLAPSAEVALIPLQNANLALELAAAGRVAIVRPTFEVSGFRDLYRVPSLGMAALARGVFRFR
jgi:hypothetical protein